MTANGNIAPRPDDNLDLAGPTPQDYGFPANPGVRDSQTWERQESFLKFYAKYGQVNRSARAAGVHPHTVDYWQSVNRWEFSKRMVLAYQDYRESIEREDDEWMEQSKHNTQIMRIHRKKSIWPEKYREETKVYVQDSAKELLNKLTEMAGKEIEERKKLEGGAT
jgi:hypothetical protein